MAKQSFKFNIAHQAEQDLEDFIDKMADKQPWVDDPINPLNPVKPLSGEEKRNSFKKGLKNLINNPEEREKVKEGCEILEKNLGLLSNEKECRKTLIKAGKNYEKLMLDIINNEASDLDTENSKVDDDLILADLPTLADQLKITSDEFASFYEVGLKLYEQKKHLEAARVFQFLTVLNAFRFEVWIARGMCHQILQEWFHAIHSYTMASLSNPLDPISYIYAAECFIEIKDWENTKGSLGLAEYFNRQKKDPAIENKIKEIRALI